LPSSNQCYYSTLLLILPTAYLWAIYDPANHCTTLDFTTSTLFSVSTRVAFHDRDTLYSEEELVIM
jgi:hypothetical protein